jgi:hypothetical protein
MPESKRILHRNAEISYPQYYTKKAPPCGGAVVFQHMKRIAYQLALVMPGIWPLDAISRSVMRERPNLR